MNRFTTLIIGLGNIGMLYDDNDNSENRITTHCKAASLHDGFKLLGAVDCDIIKCKKFEINYNLPHFLSIEEALSKFNPQVIIIATSTETHYSILEKVINLSKTKTILCEKPLSYDLNESKKIISLCLKNKINLYVNYMRRCDPGVIKLKDKIEKSYFKYPFKGICWYNKGLYNNCSHFINLFEFLLGKVNSHSVIDNSNHPYNDDPNPDFKLAFDNGEIYFHSSWHKYYSFNNFDILFKNGKLSYKNGGELIYWQKVVNNSYFSGYRSISDEKNIIKSGMNTSQFNVLDMLFNELNSKETSICKGFEALDTLKCIDKIRGTL